jgi:hypothetical protein
MIWVAEDSNVGMQSLKRRLGVLRTYCSLVSLNSSSGWDTLTRQNG